MRRIETALRKAVSDLRDLGRNFAVLGGFAISARLEPRTTRDVDLAVAVASDADAEQLAFQLHQRGYTVKTTVEQKHTGRLATVRTMSPSNAIVDLLFASSGIEAEIVNEASLIEVLPDFEVPVATLAHLIATKVLARDDRRRPQDRVDLGGLINAANVADLDKARQALHLITTRGFNRGRDLLKDLDGAVMELRLEH